MALRLAAAIGSCCFVQKQDDHLRVCSPAVPVAGASGGRLRLVAHFVSLDHCCLDTLFIVAMCLADRVGDFESASDSAADSQADSLGGLGVSLALLVPVAGSTPSPSQPPATRSLRRRPHSGCQCHWLVLVGPRACQWGRRLGLAAARDSADSPTEPAREPASASASEAPHAGARRASLSGSVSLPVPVPVRRRTPACAVPA